MNNKYRVKMQDSVNGETFTFAVFYNSSSANGAKYLAFEEFGDVNILEVKRLVEGGYTEHLSDMVIG